MGGARVHSQNLSPIDRSDKIRVVKLTDDRKNPELKRLAQSSGIVYA